jgi:predicted permease
VRQLLAESVVLGSVAGVVGLLAAMVSLQALVTLLPADTPRLADVALRWPVFLFAAAASVVTGVLFGLIPAMQMASPNLRDSLHAGSRSVAGKAGQFRVSMLLVMGQIALSVVVITAAGLMLHSLWSLMQVNPGFQTERIVTAEVSLDANACPALAAAPGQAPVRSGRCASFYTALLDRLHGLAGTENAALTDALPLTAREGNYVYDAEGHPRDARQGALLATSRTVTPDYFATLGVSLLRGRLLETQDAAGASRAVVINEHMAQRLWPNEDPLGRHLLSVQDEPAPAVWNANGAVTVVGIVANTHEGTLAGGFGDEAYLPLTSAREQPVMYAVLRTRASTQTAAEELRQAVADVDPLVPVTRVRTLNEVVAATESGTRSLTLLLLTFGGLAVVIGGVGVYSLIAYIVSWRTREIGIRLALGAQRWQIISGVVRQSLLLALGGSALGLTAAALVAQLLRSFLYGVRTVDPLTFGAVAVLMTLLALVAAWVPARRAASVDPMKTLRSE